MTTTVVCLPGDGIGPEVTAAMKRVVAATDIDITWLDMPAGQHGIAEIGDPLPQITIDAIARHRLAIKGPTNTPQGKGFSSVNVKLRQHFDLYVGLRPFKALPLPGQNQAVDIVLFRENTEGLYACKEELIVQPNGKKRVRLTAEFSEEAMTRLAEKAFAYAKKNGRKTVMVVTKSNIHKLWGRLYIDAFEEVAMRYRGIRMDNQVIQVPADFDFMPTIEARQLLVDAANMLVAADSPKLDVLVTENMFGDILSDGLAGRTGGLGVAPGANLGDDCAIFEAVHGSADDIASKDLANPTALILSAAMLLSRIGDTSTIGASGIIHQAVREVMSAGTHLTGDLRDYLQPGTEPCSTTAFTDALVRQIADIYEHNLNEGSPQSA